MDPITLIVTALAAGAAEGAKDTASTAVKEAYNGFKQLIARRFTGKPAAEVALTEHESKPEVWEAPLKHALSEAHVDQDAAIITAAQQLLALIQPQDAAIGSYVVQNSGTIQGLVQGNHTTTTMNFGSATQA